MAQCALARRSAPPVVTGHQLVRVLAGGNGTAATNASPPDTTSVPRRIAYERAVWSGLRSFLPREQLSSIAFRYVDFMGKTVAVCQVSASRLGLRDVRLLAPESSVSSGIRSRRPHLRRLEPCRCATGTEGVVTRYVPRREYRAEVEALITLAVGDGLEYERPAIGRGRQPDEEGAVILRPPSF